MDNTSAPGRTEMAGPADEDVAEARRQRRNARARARRVQESESDTQARREAVRARAIIRKGQQTESQTEARRQTARERTAERRAAETSEQREERLCRDRERARARRAHQTRTEGTRESPKRQAATERANASNGTSMQRTRQAESTRDRITRWRLIVSQCNREDLTQQPQRDLSVKSHTEDPQKQPGRMKQPPLRYTAVVQCAWQAANTVRRSNKKKKNSNRNNHCRWHALRSVRDSLSPCVGLRPTVAQLRRGGVRKDAWPGRIMVVETCEDLSARRVRVAHVYDNVTAVRWVVRLMLDELLQHLAYNSRSSTGACSAIPDGIVTV